MNRDLKFDKKRGRVKYCPCGKSNKDGKFSPFRGYDNRGKCFSCDKVFWPDSKITSTFSYPKKESSTPKTSFMKFESVLKSCKHYGQNSLAKWMMDKLGDAEAQKLFGMYYLGSSKKWEGASVFWQIDIDGKVRTGKIMGYDHTGHRVKEPRSLITWVHSHLRLTDYNLQQCFFGEHLLLQNPSALVCIVESEKTAMICKAYFPECVWLATGGKSGCNFYSKSVNGVLKNRSVILFPDEGAYELWLDKSTTIPARQVEVSKHLEDSGPQFKGCDMADILLETPISVYQKSIIGEKGANRESF